MVDNKTLVTWFKSNRKPEMLNDLLSMKHQLSRLSDQIKMKEDEVDFLNEVTEVYKGMALRHFDFGSTVTISATDSEITTRAARVYRNANNRRKWGVHTCGDLYGFTDQKWYGANWKSKREIMEAAKDWVVSAKVPDVKA
jgi:hypothetical protein